ncbi:MAG: hypothetical protein C1943_10410 [Halochromatium sp.]|nr:hypothetical protein [Halochromatium sp.]
MRELLARIAAETNRAAGTTLVVGAGHGAELQLLRRLEQQRLVLVEPHPQYASELSARIRPTDGEEVWPLAIAPDSTQPRKLLVLSNLRYSSLCEPGRLLEHGPNLRKQAPIEVSVRTLADAIETVAPQTDANNLLILDAPGLGVELLECTDGSLIQRFAWLIVHASAVPELYRGEQSHEKGTERLAGLGFVRVEEDPDALYPEVVTLYRRDDHRIEVLRQQNQVERLHSELSEARERASWRAQQYQHQLAELGAERDGLLQRLQAADEVNARLTASQATLTEERDAQAARAERLQQELDEQRASERDLARQLRSMTDQRDAQAARVAAAESRLEALDTEIARLTRDKQALGEAQDVQAHQLSTLNDEVSQLRAERARLHEEKQALEAGREEQAKRGANELIAKLDRAEQKLSTQQQRIDQLEYELTESSSRQRLLDEELIKAEAQLDLVKDLLLREQTL